MFDNNIFAEWLNDDQPTLATSPAQPISNPFHPSIVPSSPSVASSSSLSSPLSTSLSTSPPAYNTLQQEFFDAPQYSGSTNDVSSYDSQFLAAYPHSYLQPPVWATNLWESSTNSNIMSGEQFPVQTAVTTTTIDPSFVHSRESSPNDVFDYPPSPLFINPHNLSTSPTLAAAESTFNAPISATRPQLYPTQRRSQADQAAFLSTSAPSVITPLSYSRSPRPPVLIPAALSPWLWMRVPEIPMPPSEDPSNARSHLETNLALLPINLRVNIVCTSSIHLFRSSITNLMSLIQYRQNPSSDHPSWPLPHGNCMTQTSSREPKRTPPRSSTSHRLPRRPVKSTQTSAAPRKKSVPFLISAFPNLTAIPPLF